MATKRIIQLPTLNNWQVTWGNSSQAWYLRKLPNELPWGDWPNPKNVIQTPQTDANGNITGWWWKKTAMNSPEEPEVWTYKWNNGVVQTIDKRVQQGWQPATTYGSKTDRSAALLNTGKNWATNWLPQATPAGLPWVTKYAGIDKNYWNNQAGIDLVNRQGSTEMLTAWEAAQRTAGQYEKMPLPWQKIANVVKYQDNSDWTTTQYLDDGTSERVRLVRNVDWTYSTQDVWQPAPTVATTQSPVIKKTLDKPQEQTVTPAVLQGADMNTLNSTLDELKYKVNVEGKQLTKDEYMTFESAKRQLQDMMKPQALTGGLDGLIANKENEIKQVTDESKINNEQELADFTRSQEVYKQAEVDAIEQADEESKKTLWFILGWQWAGQGTFAVEQIGKITQNSLAKKQALNEAVQAKIDLYGSQLRKDSQQTIQAMKDRLDSYYMKAAEFDVDNIKQMNEYNAKEWASKIEQIDKMMALAQSQAMVMQPLTEQEKAQAQAFAGNLYDNEWNFQNNVFEMLYKVNPKLANAAVMQGTAIQKERLSNDLAMKWLDADIKRAQLNKLLNPAKEYEYIKDADWNTVAIDKENPNVQIKISGETNWLWDMRNLASQFPWQARAKNNNPAGITWNANFDNPKPWTTAYALQQAGVNFEKGTPRPWNEGGNYVTFPTMEDWLAAQRIMMTQTYGNSTVGNMLAKRVWTGEWPRYAQQVAWMAGVDVNATVNQLSDEQLQTLQMAKIQKESPWLAKILQQQQTQTWEPSWKKQLPAGNASEIGAMRTAIDQTKNLWSIIEKYKKEMWPIAWNIWKINRFDTDAQTANAEFNRITQIIGKSLEWGKLAEGDIKRYIEMLPNITDNPEVAKNKLASSQQYLNDLYAWQVKSLGEAGYNVKDFYKWIEQPLNQSQTTTTATGWWRRQG